MTFTLQDSFLSITSGSRLYYWIGTGFVSIAAIAITKPILHHFNRKKPWKVVQGWVPIIGHFHLVSDIQRMVDILEDWAKQQYATTNKDGDDDVGCYEIDLGGNRYIVAYREDRIMEILKHRPYKVQRNPNVRESANCCGATGVFSAEMNQWKGEKKVISAVFNRNNMHDYLPILKDMTKSLVTKWKKEVQTKNDTQDTTIGNQGTMIVISSDIGHMIADSISKVILNKDFDFLNNPKSEMATTIFTSFQGFVTRIMSPIWYWRIPIVGQDIDGYGKYIRKISTTINAVVEDFELKNSNHNNIKQQQQSTTTSSSSTRRTSFLSKLYKVMEQENSNLSRERIVGNITTAFVAGVDTTSKTMITALYLLACDKNLQNELRDHVKGFDLDKSSLDDLYTGVPLLKSFLHEVHRCYGVPFILLQTASEIPFCGTTLPAGTDVAVLARTFSIESLSNEVPLGPDKIPANQFYHRRYLVPTSEGNGKDDGRSIKRSNIKWTCVNPIVNGTAFLNFGHGSRSCPGRLYSEALTYCAIIKLLQTFESFELAPNHPPVEIVFDSVMAPNREIRLQFSLPS